jgi:hypothetical protein
MLGSHHLSTFNQHVSEMKKIKEINSTVTVWT